MIIYKIKVPEITNDSIKQILLSIGVNNTPIYVNTVLEPEAEVNNCFLNVSKKVDAEQGEIVYGWQFWERPYMIEAEFHAVWRSHKGEIIDITPKSDPTINKILFVIDDIRKYNGIQIDNVRINTTKNLLVDDLIEIEKARFRFLNKEGRENITGELILQGEDARIWQTIDTLSMTIQQICLAHGTIDLPCFFCKSGKEYETCHREIVKRAMLEI